MIFRLFRKRPKYPGFVRIKLPPHAVSFRMRPVVSSQPALLSRVQGPGDGTVTHRPVQAAVES